MTKIKKKIGVALCAFTMCVASIAASVSIFGAHTNVVAEDVPATSVINVEDLVTELSDEVLALDPKTDSQAQISVRETNYQVKTGLDSGEFTGNKNQTLALYSKKATEDNSGKNLNEYDGNLGVYMSGTNQFTHTAVAVKQTEAAQNKYVSLRMKYEPKDSESKSGSYVFSWTTECPSWGYDRKDRKGYNWYILNGNTLRLAYGDEANSPHNTEALLITSVTLGDFFKGSESKDVIVTFGAVENADTTRDLYFKMVDTEGTVLAELSYNDASYTYANGKPDMTELGWYSVGRSSYSWNTYIGGVNEPLVVNKTSYEVTGSYTEKALLSTVTLPTGYAFKDTSAQLTEGTNAYAGTYTYSYFGKTVTADCDITVTANSIYTYNVEDLVTELSDSALANQTEISVRAANSQVTSGLDSGDFLGSKTEARALYSQKATSENTAKNSNEYDGNLGVYMNSGATGFIHTGVAFKQNADSQNKYVSLRMKYEPQDVGASPKKYVFSWTTECPTWGYSREKMIGYTWYIIDGKTLKLAYVNGSGNPESTEELQMTSLTLDAFFKGSESKDVIVTFGAVELANTTRDLYFKMVDTEGNVLAELSYTDADYEYTAPDMTGLGWYSVGRSAGSWNTYIGGVNEPLVNKTSYEVTSGSYGEGALLSTVTLPEGYAFKDTTATLRIGRNAYEGTYTYSYFGKTGTADCDITITANSMYPNSATVKLMAGDAEIDSFKVGWQENETGEYTLPTQISNAYGTLVGWFNGNDLLKLGSTIELANGETVTLTVADIEFGVVNNSAEVRKIDNADGKYGMRFLAKISTEQYAALGNSVAWKFFYANTDEIVSAETFTTDMSNRSGVGTIANTFDIDDNYKGAYVGLSSLNYQNYNLTRSVRTFITVTYADSTTADFYAEYNEEAHSANIVDVVKKACSDETLNETERETFLNYYVNTTVEIVDTDGTFTVINYEDGYEGLNFARTYELQSANLSDGSLTLTVKMTIDASLYEGANTPNIPVTIYKKNGEVYEKIRVTNAQIVYENGVATITFTYGN